MDTDKELIFTDDIQATWRSLDLSVSYPFSSV
jgi:hypothetical protein